MEKNQMLSDKNQLVSALSDLFAKAPALPLKGKEVLVTITPWFALIFGILNLLAALALVGLSPLAAFGGVSYGAMTFVAGILTAVSGVLLLWAFPKTNKRQIGGWMLLFWVEVINVVSALVTGNIVGALVGFLIGFYILYQIKSYYK